MLDKTLHYQIKNRNERLKAQSEQKPVSEWFKEPCWGVVYYANNYIKRYSKAPTEPPTESDYNRYKIDCMKHRYDVVSYEYLLKDSKLGCKNWELYQLIDKTINEFTGKREKYVGYQYDEDFGNLVPYWVVLPFNRPNIRSED